MINHLTAGGVILDDNNTDSGLLFPSLCHWRYGLIYENLSWTFKLFTGTVNLEIFHMLSPKKFTVNLTLSSCFTYSLTLTMQTRCWILDLKKGAQCISLENIFKSKRNEQKKILLSIQSSKEYHKQCRYIFLRDYFRLFLCWDITSTHRWFYVRLYFLKYRTTTTVYMFKEPSWLKFFIVHFARWSVFYFKWVGFWY